MLIGGFLPTTLLDYPEKLACTVFTCSCDFRCPFCQNSSLVLGNYPEILDEDFIIEKIEKRKNVLEGVCITGGEPTLQKDLICFLEKIKKMGLSIKLDTNGNHPQVIMDLYHNGLIDYVAMDIKSSKENYPLTCGIDSFQIASIEKSVDYLMHCGIKYEFRTTLVKGLHTIQDMKSIARWISGASAYFLQSYEESSDILSHDFKMSAFSKEELEQFLDIAKKGIPNTFLRGVE